MTDGFSLAGIKTDTLTGRVIKCVTTVSATGGAGAILGTFKFNGADYVVTAGKTYHIAGFMVFLNANPLTAGAYLDIRYADNAALTVNPISVLTLPAIVPANYASQMWLPCGDVQIPAGKYVGVWNPSGSASGTAQATALIGFEE